jgi:hypothetical protein
LKEKKQPHTIRFPLDLYRLVHEMAVKQERTFNQQVIYLLTVGVQTVLKRK